MFAEKHTAESVRPTVSPQLIQTLQNRIRNVETAQRMDAGDVVSNGCPTIDRLLPQQGYAKGSLVQWLTAGGCGADYLSLRVAQEACREGGALVIADPENQFYPPAAAAIGIDMGNLIVLQTNRSSRSNPAPESSGSEVFENDLFWSIDQALRCPAVGAVWGPLGHIDERWFRRFQLSAESSGCLGLFVQSVQEARTPSWAEVQWLVSGASFTPRPTSPSTLKRTPSVPTSHDRQQTVRLQLTRCRAAPTGKSIDVSINTITGAIGRAERN